MALHYNEAVIHQVEEANDIIEVVSEYVTLKKTGNSYKGKCPFHNEKTASFTVSQEKQLYHCFGCGAGGNTFGFIMAIENLPFMDALKFLAQRAHIMLPENGGSAEESERYRKKERLYELHRTLANFYYGCLKKDRSAQYYLGNRGIKAETIKAFGLGLAPEGWQNSMDFLKGEGYTDQEILESGVATQSNGNTYDRFRNRMMFPIINPMNRIVGFGGRRISEEDKGPKYLNSPESLIFSKGTELFNMNHAKGHVASGQILLVEGYMDVISLFQHGIKNTVAALGTAFTAYHAALLGRYVNDVILCFDGDEAGESATQKAIVILKKTPLNVRILRLPADEDPDSYIQKHGREAFEETMAAAITIVEYEIGLLKKRYDINRTDERIKYVNQAIVVIRQLEDEVPIDLYSKRLSRETGIDLKVIRREVYRKMPRTVTEEEVGPKIDYWQKLPKAYEEAQIVFLRQSILEPSIFDTVALNADYFSPGFFRELYELLKSLISAGEVITPAGLLNHFENAEQVKPVTAILVQDVPADDKRFKESIKCIERYYNAAELERIKEEIKAADVDSEKVGALMAQMVALKREL